MSRFAEKFLSGFDRLKGPSFSPKWSEVNLHAPVKGWQRFERGRAMARGQRPARLRRRAGTAAGTNENDVIEVR